MTAKQRATATVIRTAVTSIAKETVISMMTRISGDTESSVL
jgi:hypothetical protein